MMRQPGEELSETDVPEAGAHQWDMRPCAGCPERRAVILM